MKKILAAVLCAMMLIAAIPFASLAFEPSTSNYSEVIYKGTFGKEVDGINEFYFKYYFSSTAKPSQEPEKNYSYLEIGINPDFSAHCPDEITGVIPTTYEHYVFNEETGEDELVEQSGSLALPWNHEGYDVEKTYWKRKGGSYTTQKEQDYLPPEAFGNLQKVEIGEGICNIPEGAFANSPALFSVEIAGEDLVTVGVKAFAGTAITSVVLPDSVEMIDQEAYESCFSLTDVEFPASIAYVGKYAFRYSGVTSLEIPGALGYVEDSAFECMPSLTSVVIGEGIGSIGEFSFTNDQMLESVILPSSLTSIGANAFRRCTSLNSVEIPAGVSYIGMNAFKYCKSLSEAVIPDGITAVEEGTFYGCESLASVTLPAGLLSIEREAFYGCASLESLTVPASVKAIKSRAFGNCSSLVSLAIPEGIASVANYLFYGCAGLENVTIPSTVTNLGKGAFYGCSSLGSVTLPEGLLNIGSDCFYECGALESINLPATLKNIGKYAFCRCGELKSLVVPSAKTIFGKNAYGYYYSKDSQGFGSFDIAANTIYGVADSRAQTYANNLGLTFVEN